jgi:hypothetical protein
MATTRATGSVARSSRSSWILELESEVIRKRGQSEGRGRGRVWQTNGQGRIWDLASSIDGARAGMWKRFLIPLFAHGFCIFYREKTIYAFRNIIAILYVGASYKTCFPSTMLFILFCLSSSLAMVDSFLACWLFFVLRYLVTVQLYHVSHAQLRDTSITNYPPISIHTVLSFLSSCLYSIIFDLLH